MNDNSSRSTGHTRISTLVIASTAVLGLATTVSAQDGASGAAAGDGASSTAPDTAAGAAVDAAAAPHATGILPIPDYSGDLASRRALLGDLWGTRTDLANIGIQFGIDLSNTLQSVVDGGRRRTTQYGGSADFNLTLDLMRMDVLPGALVRMRGESRWGRSINGAAGPLVPANVDLFMPLTSTIDEDVPFALTTLTYYQFLSETFGVFIGKFDTLDGDGNEFAAGRGLTQFQNSNFVYSPALMFTVPYSTLGTGIIWKPKPTITFTSTLMATSDSSTTSGFSDLDEGLSWVSQLQVQYWLGHLPGGFNLAGSYAFDNDFQTVGRRFTFVPGEGITPTGTKDSSWAVYASAWQYFWVADNAAASERKPIDLLDGVPDHQGFGMFARFGFADEDTNPIRSAVSVGLGGRGPIPGRPDDLFGVAYYYNDIQTRRLTDILGVKSGNQGFEAFYNLAITPATGLTFGVQVLESPIDRLDTAVIVGGRLLVRF